MREANSTSRTCYFACRSLSIVVTPTLTYPLILSLFLVLLMQSHCHFWTDCFIEIFWYSYSYSLSVPSPHCFKNINAGALMCVYPFGLGSSGFVHLYIVPICGYLQLLLSSLKKGFLMGNVYNINM